MLRLKEAKSDIIDIFDLPNGIPAIVTGPNDENLIGDLVQRQGEMLFYPGRNGFIGKFFVGLDVGEMFVKPLKTGDILEYVEEE